MLARVGAGSAAATAGTAFAASPMMLRRSLRKAWPLIVFWTSTVGRVDLAAGEFKFAEAIERAGDRGLRDIEVCGETADGVRTFLEVAGQEYTKLPGR